MPMKSEEYKEDMNNKTASCISLCTGKILSQKQLHVYFVSLQEKYS